MFAVTLKPTTEIESTTAPKNTTPPAASDSSPVADDASNLTRNVQPFLHRLSRGRGRMRE